MARSSSIEESFEGVIDSCRSLGMNAASTVRAPAAPEIVKSSIARAFGREPSEQLRRWFALHDGQDESWPGGAWPITAWWILVGLDEAIAQHEYWVLNWAEEGIEEMEIVWRSSVPVLRFDNYWVCASVDSDEVIVDVPHGDGASVHTCDLVDLCDTIVDVNNRALEVEETTDPPSQELTVRSDQIDDELRSRTAFQILYGGH